MELFEKFTQRGYTYNFILFIRTAFLIEKKKMYKFNFMALTEEKIKLCYRQQIFVFIAANAKFSQFPIMFGETSILFIMIQNKYWHSNINKHNYIISSRS